VKYLVLSFLFITSASAQEVSQDEIMERLKELKSAPIAEYMGKMREVSEISEEYIRTKEQECSGQFSSWILDEAGERKRVKKKLSKKEKKLCLYLLIDFRIKFTKTAFTIRRNHLAQLHQLQIKEMQELEEKQIQELEKLAKKFK